MIVAGTGHRPNRWGYTEPVWKAMLATARAALVTHEPTVVISGMAQGWDTALAVAALQEQVPLRCYVPFPGFEQRWTPNAQAFYLKVLARAQKVRFVKDEHYPSVYYHRDIAMVEDCDEVLALWSGDSQSGTYATVQFAYRQRKPVHNFYTLFIDLLRDSGQI